MASNAGVTLDTIVIEIESNAAKANDSLEKLTKTLGDLKGAIKGGFNGLNRLSEGLSNLNKASAKLPKTIENLSHLKNISKSLKSLSSIDKPTGMANAIKNISQIPEVFARIDTRTLENVTRVSSALANALTPLANKMAMIGEGYSKISMLADRYGVSVTKIREKLRSTDDAQDEYNRSVKQLTKIYNEVSRASSNFGKTSVNVFNKINSKIKQVALSLLGTRTLFTAVRKAVSEYMQLDEGLTKTTQNLWRALGAQLAPLIEYVLSIFEYFVRVIYSLVYALTGVDLIARANSRALAALAKAAKDALANLQKFDDLNVVDFKENSLANGLINLSKIDLTPIKEVIDWLKKLKKEIEKAWSTGEWGTVANVFFNGIASAIDAIPWHTIGEKVREVFQNIPWKEIWDGIVKIAKEAFKGLGEFFNGLFGLESDDSFGKEFLGTLLAIYAIIQLIKGVNGILGIGSALGLLSSSPSLVSIIAIFGGLAVIVLSIYKGIQSWKKLFEDPSWEAGWDVFYDTLLMIAGVVGGIALLFGNWPVALFAALIMIVLLLGKYLTQNLDSINSWAFDMSGKLGSWMTSYGNTTDTGLSKLAMSWSVFTKDTKKETDGLSRDTQSSIEKMVNSMITGFNMFGQRLKTFKITTPNWITASGAFGATLMSLISFPKLSTGTNEVPYEGLYHLHPGEAVVPKKYNPALGNGTDEEVGEKLDTLIGIMNNMNFTNVVNIGNKTLYKEQQRYSKMQNDKYGTTVNL